MIDEAHAFRSGVVAFVEVERELNVVAVAFVRRLNLRLRLREGSFSTEDPKKSNEQEGFTTEDTEKTPRGKMQIPALSLNCSSSVSSVVQITSR